MPPTKQQEGAKLRQSEQGAFANGFLCGFQHVCPLSIPLAPHWDHSPAAGGSGQTPGSAASACSQHSLLCIWLPEQLPAEQKKCVGKSLRRPEPPGPKEGALGAPLKTYSSELPSFGGGFLMHRHTHGHTVIFLLKQKQVQQEPGEEAEEEPGGHFCLPL